MAKFRSSQNFATSYASYKQGIAIGIENFIHLKEEVTAGTFLAPGIGTQGSSASASSPSIDLSGGTNTTFKINVDGLGIVSVSLTVAGLSSGVLIAAAMETGINTALSTAGYDARVWVAFSTIYTIKSQKTGLLSSVVVTAGVSNDVSVDLKIGLANTGVEVVGTVGGDFLYATKASLKMTQDIQPSEHKSGRQSFNIIKKKKMADGEIQAYFNVASGGSPTLDTPMASLLTGLFGVKTTVGSSEIRFDSGAPQSKFYTMVQGNNTFARYFNGCYVTQGTFALPGSGEAKMTLPIKARDGLYASVSKISGAVAASATVILTAGESTRFDIGAYVMVVSPDGRTVVAGQDGSLTVASRTDGSDTVVLSTTVTVADLGFLVPWMPHVFDQTGTDNPLTGLTGTVSLDGGATTIDEIKTVELKFDPKIESFDDWYGFNTNRGYSISDRSDINIKLDVVLSAQQANQIVRAKEFQTSSVKIVLGSASGRHITWVFPRVFFKIPAIEIPDKGHITMTLEGPAMATTSGGLDAITMSYL
jgi:hypothetical protein